MYYCSWTIWRMLRLAFPMISPGTKGKEWGLVNSHLWIWSLLWQYEIRMLSLISKGHVRKSHVLLLMLKGWVCNIIQYFVQQILVTAIYKVWRVCDFIFSVMWLSSCACSSELSPRLARSGQTLMGCVKSLMTFRSTSLLLWWVL